LKLFKKSISLFITFFILISIVFAVTTFSVNLNSPDNNTYTADNTPTLNITISGSELYYICEVLINNIGYGIYNDFIQKNHCNLIYDDEYSLWYTLEGGSDIYINDTSIFIAGQSDGLISYTFDGINFTTTGDSSHGYSTTVWSDSNYVYSAGLNTFNVFSFNDSGYNSDSFTVLDTISSSGPDGYYNGLYGDGTYIYITQFENGLFAYTFNGTDLIEVGSIDEVVSPAQGRGIYGDGTYIYMAKGSGGIVAYTFNGTDFSNVGSRDDGTTYNIWVNGSYIYAANSGSGLYVYSFDGSTFTVEDSIDDGGSAIFVSGTTDYIYIANYADGVRAYTFDGSTLVNVGHSDDSNEVNSVGSDDVYVYTTDYSDGIRVYTFPGLLNNSANILTTNSSLPDGTYDWNVNCTSNSTTFSSESRTIIIDVTAPVISISELYPAILVSTDTLTINISCSDVTTPDNITGYWNTYKNHVLQSSLSGSVALINSTQTTVQTIISGNISASDVWYSTITCGDLTINSTAVNTTLRTVQPEFSIILNSHSNNSYSQDTEPDYNMTVSGSVDTYSCELFIDTLGYGINATVLNATDTIFTTNSTLSQGTHSWNVTCQSGSVTNSSEHRTITIDNIAPVINSNQTSTAVPIYRDTINITANVTDATTAVTACYFNLTDPNANVVINNVNGTQVGDIWNSTNYQLNVSGNWTVNISCSDIALNMITSSWIFRADLGTITQIPTSKTYSQIAGVTETFNLTISHTGNNNNTLDFDIIGDIADTNNFTVTFSEDPTTIEESETQIITVEIDTNSTLTADTFTGNITWNRTEDGTTDVIEVTIYISAAVGNVISTPATLTSLAVSNNSVTTTSVNITNDGTRLLNNCNISIDTGLATYTTFNNNNFNVSINATEIIYLTITRPIIDIYDTTITTTCISTDENGLDSDTSSLIVSVSAEVLSGGGGGGISLSSCGDNICSVSETIESCPQDCILPYEFRPREFNVTITNSTAYQGYVVLFNGADKDYDFFVRIEDRQQLQLLKQINGSDDFEAVYELSLTARHKIGLISGENTIQFALSEPLPIGDHTFHITFSSGSNVYEMPINFHVIESKPISFDIIIFLVILFMLSIPFIIS